MRKRWRALSVVLAAMLCMTAFVGCQEGADTSETASKNTKSGFDFAAGDGLELDKNGSQAGNNQSGNTQKPTDAESVDNTPAPGFKEKPTIIKLGSIWGEIYNRRAGTDSHADAYKKKVADIKKKYNVVLQMEMVDGNTPDIIAKAISAGDKPYDLMELALPTTRNMGMKGYLLDQNKIPGIDLQASQFKQNEAYQQAVTFKGATYGSTFGFQMMGLAGMFVNQTLIDKYVKTSDLLTTTNVMELYRKGLWNFERFRAVCKEVARDTNGDGKNDIWGTVGGNGLGGFLLTANAGGTVIRTSVGKYEPAMVSQQGVTAYNFLRALLFEDGSFNNIGGMAEFKAGKVAFLPTYLIDYYDVLTNTDAEVDFVPIPIGPDQKTHIMGTYWGKYWSVPKTADNLELLGKVYQELSTMDVDSAYRYSLENSGMSKATVNEVFQYHKYIAPEFIAGVDVSAFNHLLDASYNTAAGNPATTFAAVKQQFQKAVDDYYGKS